MAYRMAPVLVTLNDPEGHSPVECHDLDSGAECFGDDLASYRNSLISYSTCINVG